MSSEITAPDPFDHLNAITSLDGRFRGRAQAAAVYFSEQATISRRVFIEIEYPIALRKVLGTPLGKSRTKRLRAIAHDFSAADGAAVWALDVRINHDTKAVELFLAERLAELGEDELVPWLHFGLTSADIDGSALTLALRDFVCELYLPAVKELLAVLSSGARAEAATLMLARTHGQPGIPTTVGKELAVFGLRVEGERVRLAATRFGTKFSGHFRGARRCLSRDRLGSLCR